MSDFRSYSCLLIDEYGERDLHFKFDQAYLSDLNQIVDESLIVTTRTSVYHKVYQKTTAEIVLEKTIKLNDVTIDSEFIINSNDIKIKCRTGLGKFLNF